MPEKFVRHKKLAIDNSIRTIYAFEPKFFSSFRFVQFYGVIKANQQISTCLDEHSLKWVSFAIK